MIKIEEGNATIKGTKGEVLAELITLISSEDIRDFLKELTLFALDDKDEFVALVKELGALGEKFEILRLKEENK